MSASSVPSLRSYEQRSAHGCRRTALWQHLQPVGQAKPHQKLRAVLQIGEPAANALNEWRADHSEPTADHYVVGGKGDAKQTNCLNGPLDQQIERLARPRLVVRRRPANT